jgi:hypothetical protein
MHLLISSPLSYYPLTPWSPYFIKIPLLKNNTIILQKHGLVCYCLKQESTHNTTFNFRNFNSLCFFVFFQTHKIQNLFSFQRPMITILFVTFSHLTGGRSHFSPWGCLRLRHPFPVLRTVPNQCKPDILG